MTPMHYRSLTQTACEIRAGRLSPVTLTECLLDRIAALNPRLHAFVHIDRDGALRAAGQAEEEIREGRWRGPLHGIGFALKDNFDTRGMPTTACSNLFRERVPSRDATVVARLKSAGAIVLGKLTMSELAMVGRPGFGEEARNPWRQTHVPGWSSSGSGVAVAAGLCHFAMGTDSGGSVRFPAASNSIVGMIPTFGRISRRGMIPLTESIDFAGPLARTVEDVAAVLQAAAGEDNEDRAAVRPAIPDFSAALGGNLDGVRVGVVDTGDLHLHADVENAVSAAIRTLETLGAKLIDVKLPYAEHAHIVCSIIYLSEGHAIYRQALRERPEQFGEVFRLYGNVGALFSAADYVQAQKLRGVMKRELSKLYQSVDILALPVSADPPGLLKDFDPLLLSDPVRAGDSEYFNLAGGPALSVPCGFSSAGLPIGLQLAARPFNEVELLQVAHAYQEHAGWREMHPPV